MDPDPLHSLATRTAEDTGPLPRRVDEAVGRLAAALSPLSRALRRAQERVALNAQGEALLGEAAARFAPVIDATVRDAADAVCALDSAAGELETSTRAIGDSLAHISTMGQEVEQTDGVLRTLKAESESVTQILEIIQRITIQSHMLGLNAAIEAARAGQYGRGFAVVASEVRELSLTTKESTTQIRESILRLQRGIDEALEKMVRACSEGELCVAYAMTATETVEGVGETIAGARESNRRLSEGLAAGHSAVRTAGDEALQALAQGEETGELLARACELCDALEQIVEQLQGGRSPSDQ